MPMYMKIDGIDGESQSPQFPGAFDVFAATNGVDRAIVSGGGGKNTAPDLSDLVVTKPAAKGSPKLFLACCKGEHLPSVELFLTSNTTGVEEVYMKYTLERCVVSSWSTSGDGGDVPTEEVSFNYSKIKWDYKAQDGSVETVHWDRATNSGG